MAGKNYNIYNDSAFDLLKDSDTRDDWTIPLVACQPLRFGRDGSKAVVRDQVTGALKVAENVPPDDPWVVTHAPHLGDPSYAFSLSRLATEDLRYTPMGVLRDIDRPSYDEMMSDQITEAQTVAPADLAGLLAGKDTWAIRPPGAPIHPRQHPEQN